ncbi:hypothetical protein Tco_0815438 [Tanacetum coccineum]
MPSHSLFSLLPLELHESALVDYCEQSSSKLEHVMAYSFLSDLRRQPKHSLYQDDIVNKVQAMDALDGRLLKFAMSSDNASSAVTYTRFVPQGQAHPLSPAYVPDPMELDEHVPVYVPEPEHPEYHVLSDDDIQVKDQPYAEDASPTVKLMRMRIPMRTGKKEDAPAPADSSAVPIVDPVPLAGDTEAFETDESAPTPRSPQTMVLFLKTSLTSGHQGSHDRMRDESTEEVMPLGETLYLLLPHMVGPGLIRSPGHDARTIARAADRAEDVGTVRGQRIAYETELHEWQRQSAKDRAVRHMMCTHVLEARAQIDKDDGSQSSGGGIRRPVQPARVCSYPDFMKCQPLNFKGTEGVVGLSQWLKKMESVFHISGCAIENQVKFATCTLLGVVLTWWNGPVRTLGHDVAYAMTWGTFKKKLTEKYCPNGEIKKLKIEL